jgi:hypothetical protein
MDTNRQGGTTMKGILVLLVLALTAMPAMFPAFASPAANSDFTLTVLNPQGAVEKGRDLAPRLDTMKGKKIAMWLSATPDQLYAGKGAELYDLLEESLKKIYPDIEIVSYTDLPMKFMPENEVVEAIVKAQPDAVVAGFGG